jgi:hypothetical protein
MSPFGASDIKQKAAVLSLSCLGLIAVTIGCGIYRNSRINARHDGVNIGASSEQVVLLLGTPSWVEPCAKSFGTPKPNCTEYIIAIHLRH